jgi:phosphoribosylformylglycinamidine synthase
MKPVGVLRFWGTNCDQDVFDALTGLGLRARWLWFADRFDPDGFSGLVLPGGFSYGDYLRPGALAACAPAMEDVRRAARNGCPVLGICNGFQVLCEARLLPGVLTRNERRRFVDRWVVLKPSGRGPAWSKSSRALRLPVAHGDGRFYADADTLARLNDSDQVWFRYEATPNGSLESIAGVVNDARNVAALMPHPERAVQGWMGGEDGRSILTGLAL